MKHVKKVFAAAMLLFVLLVTSACGQKADLVVNIGSNPDTIDPALNSAVDGATLIIHAFSGLTGFQKVGDKLEIVADCAKELPSKTVLQDGKVQYVFELKDDLKWSDGSALTAKDFEYAWKRAASSELAADYGYMFDVIDGFGTDNKDDLNVKASDDGNTLTVVLNNDVPYWFELCAFPAYMPVKQSVVDANPDTWATKVKTYVGNGPYKLTTWKANSKMVYEKNPYYHNADAVKLNSIQFALSDNDVAILSNYKNGSYKFIDTVPNDEITKLREQYSESEFVITGQLGTYYINFNVADYSIYGDKATTEAERETVRKALGLLLDRNHIALNIGQAGQQPANSFVPIGLTDADGKTPFVDKNGPNGTGGGYFSVKSEDYAQNCADAVQMLKDVGYTFDEATQKFTDFPSFEYIYNTNTGHAAIAAYLQQVFGQYGIEITLSSEEFSTFLNTRKNGNFVLARNGWLGDYNDPISFLDMWISTSGNDDAQFGKGEHANVKHYGPNKDQTWAETYDKIIEQVKASSDPTTRFALMHQAENQLMDTGAIVPIYYYTDLYMISPDIEGFFASPLGFKYFMYATVKGAE